MIVIYFFVKLEKRKTAVDVIFGYFKSRQDKYFKRTISNLVVNVVATNRDVRKEFIQQKYVQKKFISKSGHSPAVLLEVIDCAIIKGDAGLIVNCNI